MMGVYLKCAIMIRGRECVGFVVVCSLNLSIALKSMHCSSSHGSDITCLHRLFYCRSIGVFCFEVCGKTLMRRSTSDLVNSIGKSMEERSQSVLLDGSKRLSRRELFDNYSLKTCQFEVNLWSQNECWNLWYAPL